MPAINCKPDVCGWCLVTASALPNKRSFGSRHCADFRRRDKYQLMCVIPRLIVFAAAAASALPTASCAACHTSGHPEPSRTYRLPFLPRRCVAQDMGEFEDALSGTFVDFLDNLPHVEKHKRDDGRVRTFCNIAMFSRPFHHPGCPAAVWVDCCIRRMQCALPCCVWRGTSITSG